MSESRIKPEAYIGGTWIEATLKKRFERRLQVSSQNGRQAWARAREPSNWSRGFSRGPLAIVRRAVPHLRRVVATYEVALTFLGIKT
jgi:hypothetical protein